MADDTRIIEAVRKTAEEHLRHGCCFVGRAFNLLQTDLWQWSFDSETQQRAERLLVELIGLFHEGGFRLKPEHLPDLRACAAEGDEDFQRFIQAAMTKPARTARNAQGKRRPPLL